MVKFNLIRGIPGSGKSTLAKTLGYPYFEADMFFMQDGEYKFDPTKLRQAHEWCYQQFIRCLKSNKSVTISNTFTTLKEMERYITTAKDFGFEVVVHEMTTQYSNIHGVPEDKLEQMKARWQHIPDEWNVKVVKV